MTLGGQLDSLGTSTNQIHSSSSENLRTLQTF